MIQRLLVAVNPLTLSGNRATTTQPKTGLLSLSSQFLGVAPASFYSLLASVIERNTTTVIHLTTSFSLASFSPNIRAPKLGQTTIKVSLSNLLYLILINFSGPS